MARFQEQLDRVYRLQKEREDARRLREEQVTGAAGTVGLVSMQRKRVRHNRRILQRSFCGRGRGRGRGGRAFVRSANWIFWL